MQNPINLLGFISGVLFDENKLLIVNHYLVLLTESDSVKKANSFFKEPRNMALRQTMKQLSRQVDLRNSLLNNYSVVKCIRYKPAGRNYSFFSVHYVQDSVVLDIGLSGHLF